MNRIFRNEFLLFIPPGVVLLILIVLDAPLGLLRLLIGLLFILFVPGYMLQAALFPQANELDSIERTALSLGLSIAIVSPLALLLDRLPWGIGLGPILVSESLFIVASAVVIWYRRQRLLDSQRFFVRFQLSNLRNWWNQQDFLNQAVYILLIGALTVSLISVLFLIGLPSTGEYYTEFYLLGPDHHARNYPRELVLGQPSSVTIGITNHEAGAKTYQIEVRSQSNLINQPVTLQVKKGETVELPISFIPSQVSKNARIDFLLFRNGDNKPYRSLQLWLTVQAAQ